MERLYLFTLRQRSRNLEPQTQTILDQMETEQLVRKAYYEKLGTWKERSVTLFRLHHVNYLLHKLNNLPTSFQLLDASQSWLAYWIVHSLRLLNFSLSEEMKQDLLYFLKACQHPNGGFGGGPYQFSHLATTYGAVNCLVTLCRHDALLSIDRQSLLSWLYSLRQCDGSFVMHVGGESDVRGAYCAIAVAKLTGLLSANPNLFEHTAEWIASCQTYEGGFGAHPGIEAHGGYTFCAVAALYLLGRPELIDIPRLLRWLAHRQMVTEGGFQGRTNKLVDSCYSFWQGGAFVIVAELLFMDNDPALSDEDSLFNASALQEYILFCCQKVSFTKPGLSVPPKSTRDPTESTEIPAECGGGLIDKPGKNVDCYHTCYALSGLSIAQHSPRNHHMSYGAEFNTRGSLGKPNPNRPVEILDAHFENELVDVDPIHNIAHDALAHTTSFFQAIDSGSTHEAAAAIAKHAAECCSTST